MGMIRSPLPQNQGKSPLPLFGGVIFMVILHDFIRKFTMKTFQSLPSFPRYGKLPYIFLNYQMLCFQKNVQNYLFLQKIHIPITHSLFKKQYQMCSKVHRISCKNPMVIYSRRNAHQLNTDTRNLALVLTKKGGRISSHAQCLTTNS